MHCHIQRAPHTAKAAAEPARAQPDQARSVPHTIEPTRLPIWAEQWGEAPVADLDGGWLQAKLTVNEPGDVYEQQADRVAEQVMRMPEPHVQRATDSDGPCSDCPDTGPVEAVVQTKRGVPDAVGGMPAPPIVHEALRAPGQPLDAGTRGFMESRFGRDFSQVRVHTNTRASESARAINSVAYTVGRDIVFDPAEYPPPSAKGKSLLAHELTHVIQQNGTSLRTASLSGVIRRQQDSSSRRW